MRVLVPVVLLTGCSTVTRTFDEDIPVADIARVRAEVERGEVSVVSGSPDVFQIEGRVWGRATDVDRADRNAEGNSFAVGVTDRVLDLSADSAYASAGVDFAVMGPRRVDTELSVPKGRITLEGLHGRHFSSARRIDVANTHGFLTLTATHRVVADLDPQPGDVIHITAEDGIDLTLPVGLPLHLTVWGDPEQQVRVDDLGWDETIEEEDFFQGLRGDGSIRIDIVGPDADIRVRAAQ